MLPVIELLLMNGEKQEGIMAKSKIVEMNEKLAEKLTTGF